jgi:undecaprenyl-diphosphatase
MSQDFPRKKIVFSATGLLVLYLTLCFFVNKDIFRDLDFQLTIFLQKHLNRIVDFPFSVITLLGSSEITFTALIAIFAFIFHKKKVLFFGLSLFLAIFLLEIIGKLTIYHPKPPTLFFRNVLNFSLPSATIVDTHYSFPSGHMSRTAYLGTVGIALAFLLGGKSKIKWIIFASIFLFILLVFVSRIYLGEHWASDVLGGLILGSCIGLFSIVFY